MLAFTTILFSLLFILVQPRYESPQEKQNSQIMNDLITQRDRQMNRVYYRITYQQLVETERRARER